MVTQLNAATVEAELPAPVVFGDWIMRTREFAVVRVVLSSGVEGWAFGLTRDGAIAEQIRKTLRNIYVGTSSKDLETTFKTAQRRPTEKCTNNFSLDHLTSSTVLFLCLFLFILQ